MSSVVVGQQQQHNIPTPSSTTKLGPRPPSPSSSSSSSSTTTIVPLDFSTNPVLRQVTTLLRRVWLLDPPLSDEELANATTVGQCLQSVTQLVSQELSTTTSSSKEEEEDDDDDNDDDDESNRDDDEEWKVKTQFRLLTDPVVLSAEKEEAATKAAQDQEGQNGDGYLKGVLSPWREEIYDVYRHVFADFWRMVVTTTANANANANATATAKSADVGVFEPTRGNAVSVAALPAPVFSKDGNNATTTTTTSFQTDTFLYPVWVNPEAKVSFLAEGKEGEGEEKHCWLAGEDKTLTTGLWVKAGQGMVLKTEMSCTEGEGEEKTGLAAVFVTGHCDKRQDG